MSLLNTKQIMEIIPHRQPFLLIDTIEELEAGKRAVGTKCVTYNEPFFAGHFPEEPVMPGVLIIEALAQTGAVAILSQPEFQGKTAYFAAINSAKFRQKVQPGDVLRLETEIIKRKGGAVAILSQPEFQGKTAYFAAINSAKFRQKVQPGDVLRLETEIIKRKGPIGIGSARAYVGEKLAAEAELTFAVSDKRK